MKKKLFSLLLILSLLLALGSAVFAEPEAYVFDLEGRIPGSELQELQTLGGNIYRETGVAVCALICSNPADDLNAYAEEFYNSHVGEPDGILLVHDVSPEHNTIVYYLCGDKLGAICTEDMLDILGKYNEAASFSDGVRSYMNLVLARLNGQTVYGDVTPEDNPAIPTDRRYDRVADFAGVIGDSELRSLNELADEVSERYKCDIAVALVPSLEGKDVVSFADDFYDYNGYGYGYDDDGMLLLISVGDREYATTTYGTGRNVFTPGRISSEIEPEVIEHLKKNDWAGAARSFIDCSAKVLEKAASGAYDNGAQSSQTQLVEDKPDLTDKLGIRALISAVIGFFTGGIPAASMKRQLKSVKKNYGAGNYTRRGLQLRRADDFFLSSNVTRTPKPQPQDNDRSRSSGFSSGGSVHFSSSGRSHGGTHGKF